MYVIEPTPAAAQWGRRGGLPRRGSGSHNAHRTVTLVAPWGCKRPQGAITYEVWAWAGPYHHRSGLAAS
ncbi:hypothetical protein PtA15_4A670 [Puccinia triticina]|uniref:Uncharacterized protein n=1 Tax=Puccinia triticina TaxID=208348 RepID=A0ABY7CG86_9BASI|nr:uncharacterized protein PtA15_4A670 [Puccinia triticina]WAQ84218.1 hypothetical protein PtA15_4A670 [Puccinia triticina]WAR55045.1 hypothetical protein PtB15_4B664 [Puccinia triticina]